MLAEKRYRGDQADLFSAAVVLFTMVAQKPPFEKSDKKDWYFKSLQLRPDLFWKSNSKKNFYKDDFKKLVEKMLDRDPRKRLSVK